MAIDESALDRFRDQLLAAMRVEMLEANRASEARLEERLDARLARIEASVAEMGSQVAETRRHMDVVAEGLRSDISLVAEGVVTLTERLSSEMREGFEMLDRRVMRLEARLLSDPRG
jgi:hypothetical protein